MKILIAYDGSQGADAALDDLMLAGLPADAEALVISVAEVWLPPAGPDSGSDKFELDPHLEKLVERHRQKGEKAVAESCALARHAAGRVRRIFPGWKVSSEATYGSPAWEIIARANEMNIDLVVVGSHGRTAVERFLLGSISQKVLTEAACSVRVARGRVQVDPAPARVLIGFDGSPGAQAAVRAVSERSWSEGTQIRLLFAVNQIIPAAVGRFVPPVTNWADEELQSERGLMEKLAEPSLTLLREKGLDAELCVQDGNPKSNLVREAERWHADSIFVGANALGSRVERLLLGSVSAAVAARSSCSVEVVRRKY